MEGKAQTELEPLISTSEKKKNMGKNKRRFSDEQIRSLEKMFESETKLEPKRKLQVASELCLQPRQVAIWFQNRRARWKSKQIEKEYRVLRANYDHLASQFESLKEEKQSLLLEAEKLSGLLEKRDGNQSSKDLERQSTDDSSYNWDVHRCGTEAKAADCLEEGLDYRIAMFEDNEQSTNIGCSEDIGTQYLDCSFTSPGQWCSVDSNCLFDWNF